MSRDQIRELVVLLAACSAVTIVVFFLALWLLPFDRFPPFAFPRFPGFP
jgi:hypothetical protein